jgi:hypothetical protein
MVTSGRDDDSHRTAPAPNQSPSNRKKIHFYSIALISIGTLLYMTLAVGPGIQPGHLSMEKVSNRTILLNGRQQHLAYTASTMARVYPRVPASTWCIDVALRHEQSKRRPMGLCYLKLPKAASSTLAGINKRIAKNFARRQGLSSCIRHDGHVPGMFYYKRHDLSFLWTSVRDPASRALSRVVYDLSEVPTNLQSHSIVMKSLKVPDVQYGAVSSGRGGFQLQYTMLTIIEEWSAWNSSNPTIIVNPTAIKQNVAQVMNGYNFIAVVERMDESLVALQLLLGLDVTDILYLSPAKEMGSYDRRSMKDGSRRRQWRCVRLALFNRTQELDAYFESTEWFAKNYGDYLLYAAANMSLDRTILDLGLVRFSRALVEYRALKRTAMETCRTLAIFPCSSNGTDQYEASRKSCYTEDEGCGYPCKYCLLLAGRAQFGRSGDVTPP